MPWKNIKPMDEKICFIADFLRGTTSFTDLCMRYGISRRTGYKSTRRYQESGMDGLSERSRKPKAHPALTPYAVQQAILELRQQRDPPGPKKIQAMLAAQGLEAEVIPSITTIYKILKREGQIEPRKRTRRFGKPPGPLKSANQANELWSADYKGQFMLADGRWCYPLTVMDHASRYLLACKGLTGTRYPETKAAFERFREYGLPERIRTDNGIPFATIGVANLSRLSIWWIKLGIWHERIEPGQPQQNGRHERMHRTLKRSLTEGISSSLRSQQRTLDEFRRRYNEDRPHEGLGQAAPASCYMPSSRLYPTRLPEIDYASYLTRVHVSTNGIAYWRAWRIYVGHLLAGEHVGIEQVGDGLWDVYFGPVRLGLIDETRADGDYLTLKV